MNTFGKEHNAPLTARVQQYVGCHIGPEGLEQFLDCYDISRSYKIGYGKHSDVIAATSKRSGMERAVKVLSLDNIGRAKIHKEVRAMHMFSHQHCPQMTDVLICGQQLPNVRASPPYVCIVMDHIRNAETLTKTVMRGGDPQLAATTAAQIGSALAEMHSKRLLHKDLWPENILIDNNRKAFLIDFGCSESMDTENAGPGNDVNIPYASPEMCNRLPASPVDDNWALGLVLTETITGKAVSHRMNRQHREPLFFQPSLLEEAITETYAKGGPVMGQICRQLLDMDASRRATAQQVVASAAQLGQSPLQAGPTSAAQQAVALAPQLGQFPLQAGPTSAAQQAVALAPQLGQSPLQAGPTSAAQQAVALAPQLGQFPLRAGPTSAAQQAVALAPQLGQFPSQAVPASAAQQAVALAPQLGQFPLRAGPTSVAQQAVALAPQLGQFPSQAVPTSAAQQAVALARQLGQFSLQAGPVSAAQPIAASTAKQVWSPTHPTPIGERSPSLTLSTNYMSQHPSYQANGPSVSRPVTRMYMSA